LAEATIHIITEGFLPFQGPSGSPPSANLLNLCA
jgi:hypothetical protein